MREEERGSEYEWDSFFLCSYVPFFLYSKFNHSTLSLGTTNPLKKRKLDINYDDDIIVMYSFPAPNTFTVGMLVLFLVVVPAVLAVLCLVYYARPDLTLWWKTKGRPATSR